MTHSILHIGDIQGVIMTHIGDIIITIIVILIIILIMAVVRIIQNQIGVIIIGAMKMSVAISIVRHAWLPMLLRLIGYQQHQLQLQCVVQVIGVYLHQLLVVHLLLVPLLLQLILNVVRLRRLRCLLVQQQRESLVLQSPPIRVQHHRRFVLRQQPQDVVLRHQQ